MIYINQYTKFLQIKLKFLLRGTNIIKKVDKRSEKSEILKNRSNK